MTEHDTTSTLSIALASNTVKVAIKMSLVVGTALTAINHGPAMVDGTVGATNLWQILLCYLTPYCVSTFSTVRALLPRE